ncbi:MAG TPA: radical SAM family heme chaperone HemW [Bacilli bacterium]|nr:radical SAM family heme chaperone HemW [Bacilli bacterium]
MKTNIDAVYIHIPFCNKICNYCDFSKLYYNSTYVNKYLIALSKEIDKYYKYEKINTIYIGGGTPSCLSIIELKKLFKIVNKIHLYKDYEYTFECNLEDITEDKLKLLYKNKVNRLSIGVQSLNKNILKKLGRSLYSKRYLKQKIKLAKSIGFKNINIDLMFGINNCNSILKDIKYITKLNINHISVYSLIIEPHTKFYNNNESNIDQDIESKLYAKIVELLNNNNYIQYEISNFCKKGYECKHNIKYWNNDKYYGFGLSSHGYIYNYRYENTKSITSYIDGKYRLSKTIINKKIDIENYIMLNLRKIEGININEFNKKYNIDFEKKYNIEYLLKNKYLIKEKDNVKINKKYLYISNKILADILYNELDN